MLALIAVLLSQAVPAPECRTSGGVRACGYWCRAELGEVKCAQTPEGLCLDVERHLVCWDPPAEVRLHAGPSSPRPTCKVKFNDVACGYACVTSATKIACAQTPWGVCTTRFDEVACWDPSPEVVHHLSDALAGASCIQSDSSFACGWSCQRSRQEVQCAQTPKGTCTVIDGHISCFDPPLPPISHPAPGADRREVGLERRR